MKWFDQVPSHRGWSWLWDGLSLCSCGGIRRFSECQVCRVDLQPDATGYGRMMYTIPGAEGRYEDYLYLDLIQREWLRPPSAALPGQLRHHTISERTSVVLLFWTYFESRIERLVRLGLEPMPGLLIEDTLGRYSSVGARMDRLYKLVFETTYFHDLRAIGCDAIVDFLGRVQACRNAFAHGNPSAISDALAEEVVTTLQEEHLAWVAVFNRRVAFGRSRTAKPTL